MPVNTAGPVLEVGTGVAHDPASHAAGVSAAEAAIKDIRTLSLSFVLVYVSVHYDLQEVLAGIREAVHDAPILGTTTAGEICAGVHRQSVTVVAVASPHLSVHAAIGNHVSEDWRQALKQATDDPAIAAFVRGEMDTDSTLKRSGTAQFALILYPGNTRTANSMGYELLEGFKSLSLGRIPVFGGGSADDWRMEGNAILFGDRVHPDSLLIAIFHTQLEFGISLGHGFRPGGKRMTVTAADGHELIALDSEPAAEVIAHRVGKSRDSLAGKHITLTTGYPLGSPDPLGQFSVNVASYITPRGGVMLTQPIAVGTELALLAPDPGNSAFAGGEAIRKALIRAGSQTPALILAHYCALRPRILGDAMVRQEIGSMLEIAGRTPLAGFFSFGEDGVADDGIPRHNNGIVAVLALGSELSESAKVAQENERLRLQLAEQAEQRLMADVIRQMEEAIAVIDAGLCITYVNAAFTQMFGYDVGEAVGQPLAILIPPEENSAPSLQAIVDVAIANSFYRGDANWRIKTGRLIPLRLSVSTLKDGNGVVTGYVIAMTDLTESIRSAAVVQASVARYRAAFQTSPDAVNINRVPDGKYLDTNEGFCKITGWTRDEVVGRTSSEINIWHDPADRRRLIGLLQETGEVHSFEARFVKKDGTVIYGSMSASMLYLDGDPCLLTVTRDITERKRADEQILKLSLAVEQSPESIVITDLDGNIEYVNESFVRNTGYGREEVLGRNPRILQSGRTPREVYQDLWATLTLGRVWKGELYNRRADGSEYVEQAIITPIRQPDGQITHYVAVKEDITEQKQHQLRLERLLTEQKAMLDNELIGILKVRNRKTIWANPALEKMLGYGRGELVGNSTRQLYPSDEEYLALGAAAYPVLSVGQIYRSQIRFVHKNGWPVWVDINGVMLDPESDESLWGFIDITDHKRVEAELERHRIHLEELVQQRTAALLKTESEASFILQSSADGLYGIDPDGIITFINPAACELLGYHAEQIIGHTAHETFHHSKVDGTPYPLSEYPSFQALKLGHEVRVDDEVYWHADGHPIPVMYAIHPMVQDGRVTGAVTSFVDMSEQRAAAQAREKALIAAENLARVRSEFLANMSHEIRTPLNGVLGFAEIGYRNHADSEKARNAFAKILTSGTRLLGVINDILDFSKIEAGKLTIQQTEVSIGEVIDHAFELVLERARAKNLSLLVERASGLPATCLSDPLRMGQVLLNLLYNAVKFTKAGGIDLSVSRENDTLIFRVTDTGIGMDEEQLGQLFKPFQQADASASRNYGGTGLGLAISRRILELMGGDIRVESRPGIGSTFEFRLPYVPCDAPPAAETAAPEAGSTGTNQPLAGISILAAEDEPINQMLLEEILGAEGARVSMAGNGQEAVDCVVRNGPDAYDLVLMDIQMPVMDGYEATRRILELVPGLPIIGQTAHAFAEEKARCFDAGMVGHIAKPIDPGALLNLVRRHVAPRHGD